ncbi:MAG: penicillin-binding transpeptidase domain-containing protein [Christensenellales bacterium]
MLVTFLFVAVVARLIVIQIAEGRALSVKALDQWTRDVPVTGERGDIFDRNGNLLADTATLYTVYVRPVSVTDKEKTASALGKVLGVDSAKLYEKMTSKVSEITVAKKVDKGKMEELLNSDIDGVYFSRNIDRKYIYGDFMTQILGFTNVDGVGQSGVEAYYDKYLKGIDGYVLTETDLVGRELSDSVTRYIEGSKGNSIYLTLDYAIQSFVEKALSNAYATHNATGASCVVMNAKTGEILAMAQRPSYDLNNIPRDDVEILFKNSKSTPVSNVYEPGSSFKILTAAIGLETGAVNTSYNLYCPGYRIVDGKKIRCWKTIGHGSETFIQGVQNSCNCLFMDIALKIGVNAYYDGLEKFGVTTVTGIDVSGEASGLTISKDTVKNVDLARMGFGQAVALTPVELICACASVINGGKLMRPYVLDKIVSTEGKTIVQNYPETRRTTVGSQTSETMRSILESVVNEGGGKNAKVNGYRIGGKTGTAQKYSNGTIARGMYVSTFIGFAPADDPEYILLFIVDEPKNGAYYGSVVAAPYAGQIFSDIFAYRGWEPADYVEKEKFLMPDLTGMTVTEAVAQLKKLKMYYEISGEWTDGALIKKQIPVSGSYVTEDNIVVIDVA